MLGQFLVEPELEPEPVLPVPEPDDGAVVGEEFDVEELEVELVPEVPEFPVVVDVVAALATSAPPATSPDVSAPMASTLRRRICMVRIPFRSLSAGPFGPVPKSVRSGSERSRRGGWAGAGSYESNW